MTQPGSLRFPNGLSHARRCSVRGACADRLPCDRRRPDLIAARAWRGAVGLAKQVYAGQTGYPTSGALWTMPITSIPAGASISPAGPGSATLPQQSLRRYRAWRLEDRRPRRETILGQPRHPHRRPYYRPQYAPRCVKGQGSRSKISSSVAMPGRCRIPMQFSLLQRCQKLLKIWRLLHEPAGQ